MYPSYRNKSVDLLCKSTDLFLYDGDIGRWRMNSSAFITFSKVFAKFYRFFVVKVCTRHYTKSEVSIKDLFSKCDQIRSEEILNGKLHFLSIEEQFAC